MAISNKLRPEQIDVVTGSADNDFVTTQGWVEEHVSGSNSNGMWTLDGDNLKTTIAGKNVITDGDVSGVISNTDEITGLKFNINSQSAPGTIFLDISPSSAASGGGTSDQWQSFTATADTFISAAAFDSALGGGAGTMSVLDGEGAGGTVLLGPFPYNFTPGPGFVITNFPSRVQITNGQKYTILLDPSSNTFIFTTASPYAGGTNNFGTSDWSMKIYENIGTGLKVLDTGETVVTDDLGLTGTRVPKIWATDIESTNYPSVNGTPLADQYLATTDIVSFAGLTVAADTDATVSLGRSTFYSRISDSANFAHYDFATGSNFAVEQLNDGTVKVNAPTGKSIFFTINNSIKATVDSTTGDLKLKNNIKHDSSELTIQRESAGVSKVNIIGQGNNTSVYQLTHGNDANANIAITQNATTSNISFGSSTTLLDIAGAIKISSGTFALPTGTTVNEIVTSISGSSTDDQVVTAQGAYETSVPGMKVTAPALPGSTGTTGQWAYGSGYEYRCVATDTWVRKVVSTTW